jgi:hypothetical protein
MTGYRFFGVDRDSCCFSQYLPAGLATPGGKSLSAPLFKVVADTYYIHTPLGVFLSFFPGSGRPS